jgi:glycine/D-amino acid oxidase-like deaminating enzyme
MNYYNYDIIIVGGGPIGASTAYFLSNENENKKIALLRAEPLEEDPYHIATYLYAGGSIRSYFANQEINEATTRTINFIKNLKTENVDISLIEDYYCFLNRGIMVPSVNVSGAKLINYFLSKAKEKGIEIFDKTFLNEIIEENDKVILKTNQGEFQAKKVLLALGHSLSKFLPEAQFGFKKRQLFILDIKLNDEQKNFPHLIFNFKGGVVYIFVKNINNEYKFVLGQEDIFEENEEFKDDNYFDKLINMGLLEILPFLKEAKVEKILWGFDAENKTLNVFNKGEKIIAACCGSAVRSCVFIGDKLKNILLQN